MKMEEKYKKTNKKLKDIPYTVVGSTVINDSFSVTLQVGGLKKILENTHDEDLLHIKFWSGYKATEFEISEYNKKYKRLLSDN